MWGAGAPWRWTRDGGRQATEERTPAAPRGEGPSSGHPLPQEPELV